VCYSRSRAAAFSPFARQTLMARVVWLDLRFFALLSHVIVRILSKVPLISLLKGRPVTPAL
jgi:hypothetical protein